MIRLLLIHLFVYLIIRREGALHDPSEYLLIPLFFYSAFN